MPRRKAVADDDRISALATTLCNAGIERAISHIVAIGVCAKCQCYCLDRSTDLLGNSDDVDVLLPTGLKKRRLAICMRDCGVAIPVGRLYAYTFWQPFMTRHQRRKWAARDKESYDLACSRAWTGLVVDPYRIKTPEPFIADLFGNPIEEPPNEKQTTQPGYQGVVDRWFELWAERYGGEQYSFKARDGACLKRFIASHGAEKITGALENFIRCDDPFYDGHDLSGFVHKINRWICGDKPRGRLREHGITYSGSAESPPVADLGPNG